MVWLLWAALLLPVLRPPSTSFADRVPSPTSAVRFTNPDDARPSLPKHFLELSALLHQAGVAYGRHDVKGARSAFSSIVTLCQGYNTGVSRWYYGFAEYGIASTSARLGDTARAKSAMLATLQSDYWSTDVIRGDPVLSDVVGAGWLDSLMTCFETLRDLSTSSWPHQTTFVILPHCNKQRPSGEETSLRLISLDSLTARMTDSLKIHRPLILALHGGNASYIEFALHWKAVADSLGVAVLIPPGCLRFSANDNSWDDTYNVCDPYITNVLDRYAELCGYTPDTYIAGFSQGANAGIKYGFVHSDRIKGVIAVAGLMDAPLAPEMVQNSAHAGLRIYAMSGEYETDGFLQTIKTAEHACDAGNLPFKFESVPGMAHEVPADLAPRLQHDWAWLNGKD